MADASSPAASPSKHNARSPAVRRILQECKELQADGCHDLAAEPLEDNLFEWHFAIRGPPDTDFEGGIYHGRILLPPEYPFKPPSFSFLTPNGRFEVNTKICLSISNHHPEHWQPSWSIRTALVALIAFLPTKADGALGALEYGPEERRALALQSRATPPTAGQSAARAEVTRRVHASLLAAPPAAASGSGTSGAAVAAAEAAAAPQPATPLPAPPAQAPAAAAPESAAAAVAAAVGHVERESERAAGWPAERGGSEASSSDGDGGSDDEEEEEEAEEEEEDEEEEGAIGGGEGQPQPRLWLPSPRSQHAASQQQVVPPQLFRDDRSVWVLMGAVAAVLMMMLRFKLARLDAEPGGGEL